MVSLNQGTLVLWDFFQLNLSTVHICNVRLNFTCSRQYKRSQDLLSALIFAADVCKRVENMYI